MSGVVTGGAIAVLAPTAGLMAGLVGAAGLAAGGIVTVGNSIVIRAPIRRTDRNI